MFDFTQSITNFFLDYKMETVSNERIVLVSADSALTAQALSQELVGKGLAACCTYIPGVRSVYVWNGAVEQSEEVLILIKTDLRHLEECERAVRALHPYQTMEMISWQPSEIHGPYRQWMQSVLKR